MSEAFIFDAVRTPRGRGKKDGALAIVRPVDLARQVLMAIDERNPKARENVVDSIMGCLTAIGDQGGNISKTAVMAAGYDNKVGGLTVNRFCGSGLEAINQGVARIMAGGETAFVCGGVESMSRYPIGSDGGAWAIDPEIATLTHFVPQGVSADLIATIRGYSRQDVDSFALESQKRAALAIEKNKFHRSMIPIRDVNGEIILDRDQHPRPETTLEGLGQLKAAFAQMGAEAGFDSVAIQKFPQVERINHVHHAGNSSGIVDGAAAVLVADRKFGEALSWKPRARVVSYAVTSTDPTIMLTGPAPATRIALERAKMKVEDIDLFEVNEAFAAVVMNFMDELNVDHSKVNVNGGAIALGHPIGATGAMLIGTLIDELEERNLTTGLATLCIGGGMGITTIIERV